MQPQAGALKGSGQPRVAALLDLGPASSITPLLSRYHEECSYQPQRPGTVPPLGRGGCSVGYAGRLGAKRALGGKIGGPVPERGLGDQSALHFWQDEHDECRHEAGCDGTTQVVSVWGRSEEDRGRWEQSKTGSVCVDMMIAGIVLYHQRL